MLDSGGHSLAASFCDGAQMAWLLRAGGEAALADASSRPAHPPRAIDPAKALLIAELRRRRMTQVRIAVSAGVSGSTVSRVLPRACMSSSAT
jgi:hypothetical protein